MMLKLWEIRYATYGKIFVGGGGVGVINHESGASLTADPLLF